MPHSTRGIPASGRTARATAGSRASTSDSRSRRIAPSASRRAPSFARRRGTRLRARPACAVRCARRARRARSAPRAARRSGSLTGSESRATAGRTGRRAEGPADSAKFEHRGGACSVASEVAAEEPSGRPRMPPVHGLRPDPNPRRAVGTHRLPRAPICGCFGRIRANYRAKQKARAIAKGKRWHASCMVRPVFHSLRSAGGARPRSLRQSARKHRFGSSNQLCRTACAARVTQNARERRRWAF